SFLYSFSCPHAPCSLVWKIRPYMSGVGLGGRVVDLRHCLQHFPLGQLGEDARVPCSTLRLYEVEEARGDPTRRSMRSHGAATRRGDYDDAPARKQRRERDTACTAPP